MLYRLRDKVVQEGVVRLRVQSIIFKKNDTEKIMLASSEILLKGGVIAYPTESFYALGVLATDEAAVKRLFKLKDRPADKPLPLIVGDMDVLKTMVRTIPERAEYLIKQFWPGPLTIIFEAVEGIPGILTGGTGKVAVRIPGKSAALYLAGAIKIPITATSANPSSQPPAEDPDAIVHYFGNHIDLIIDAGKAPGGKPSTIMDVTVNPPRILREGRIIPD